MRSLLAIATSLILSSSSLAYTVRTTNGGKPLRWPSGTVSIELELGDGRPSSVKQDDAEAAAVAAFDTYRDLLGHMAPDVSLSVTTSSAKRVDGNDGHNVVRWVAEDWAEFYDPGALAVTLTSYDSSSGRITDADIVVNAEKYAWSADDDTSKCRSAYDLQNVLTHEVGHLFGLGHEKEDLDATMYPSSGMCESKKRDLDDDDTAGLSDLYVGTSVTPTTKDGLAAMGCSVPGRSRGGPLTVLLVVGAMLLAARRPRAALALCLLALVAAPAGATTVRRLSLDELSADAVVVARGVVGGVVAHRVGGHIYTDVTLAVSECLKGSCGPTLVVRQLGGEIDGLGVRVEGNAELAPASEVVLMLRRRLDGTYAPLGMAQGAFRVEREPLRGDIRGLVQNLTALRFSASAGDSATPRVTLDELRAAIARAKTR